MEIFIIDWLIDLIGFYAVLANFQPYNGGVIIKIKSMQIINGRILELRDMYT